MTNAAHDKRRIVSRFIKIHEHIYRLWMQDTANIGHSCKDQVHALDLLHHQLIASENRNLAQTCRWIVEMRNYFYVLMNKTRYDAEVGSVDYIRKQMTNEIENCKWILQTIENARLHKEKIDRNKQALLMMGETTRSAGISKQQAQRLVLFEAKLKTLSI